MSSIVHALSIDAVPINSHCIGTRWSELDRARLAQLIAFVAMGQATRASTVIRRLEPATPEFTVDELCDEAIATLTVKEATTNPGGGYPRYQRDGFVFEVISWVAAVQTMGADAVLKHPHTSSTTQGVDGLLLVVDQASNSLREAVIFEDKCTDDPRAMFLSKVLPAFLDRHRNKRSAELVSTATTLLASARFAPEEASRESAKILDPSIRKYRSAFAVSEEFDSEDRRSFLFGRFEELDGLVPDQRIGACLVVSGEMRDWFDALAADAVTYLKSLKD